ncbi:MAG: recombination protein RecR [Spirochaetes bacterium]|nr:MAG: recombination protein RecR [Spirochaetota bacterium]
MNTLDLLIKNLSKLPGIGRKSASRIAYYLLKQDREFSENLSRLIKQLKERIKVCSICGNYTETNPCEICTDPARDRTVICVVERSEDVYIIESTNEYSGLYHVLMGALSPIDGIGPKDLLIDKLLKRVEEGNVKEVIIATNPTVEGDTTALYLVKQLEPTGVKITRLASGLPVGGDLEYADRLTLTRSLKGRMPFSL